MKILRILLAGFFVIAGLLYVNSIIPAPQKTQAAWLKGTQTYSCGSNLTVQLTPVSENPSCIDNSGNVNGLTSFQSGIQIKAAPGSVGAYTVHWKWASYWCQNEDPHAPCLSNESDTGVQTGGLTGNNSAFVTAYSQQKTPIAQFAGQACGYYQNDFAFYITTNDSNTVLCGTTLNNPGATNNNTSWCHTGTSCSVTTPTPTPTVVTPTPTSTPTPTPTVTATPTPTPTITVTPTPTVTPTVTPTITVTPSITPTPTTSVSCGSIDQNGNINNANCQNQNQNQAQAQAQEQNNNQTINNNANNSNTVNVNISNSGNNQQQQQQQSEQQQAVLGASVAPAVNASSLPSTGAGADVLFTLFGLLPVGLKLRKLV